MRMIVKIETLRTQFRCRWQRRVEKSDPLRRRRWRICELRSETVSNGRTIIDTRNPSNLDLPCTIKDHKRNLCLLLVLAPLRQWKLSFRQGATWLRQWSPSSVCALNLFIIVLMLIRFKWTEPNRNRDWFKKPNKFQFNWTEFKWKRLLILLITMSSGRQDESLKWSRRFNHRQKLAPVWLSWVFLFWWCIKILYIHKSFMILIYRLWSLEDINSLMVCRNTMQDACMIYNSSDILL